MYAQPQTQYDRVKAKGKAYSGSRLDIYLVALGSWTCTKFHQWGINHNRLEVQRPALCIVRSHCLYLAVEQSPPPHTHTSTSTLVVQGQGQGPSQDFHFQEEARPSLTLMHLSIVCPTLLPPDMGASWSLFGRPYVVIDAPLSHYFDWQTIENDPPHSHKFDGQ